MNKYEHKQDYQKMLEKQSEILNTFLKMAEQEGPWKDKLPGGLADKKTPEDFDQDQLQKGVKVELEHTSDEKLATEIAMDHITEDSDYYTKLEKIHKEALIESETLRKNIRSLSKVSSDYGGRQLPDDPALPSETNYPYQEKKEDYNAAPTLRRKEYERKLKKWKELVEKN